MELTKPSLLKAFSSQHALNQRWYSLNKPHQTDYKEHHYNFSVICSVPFVKCFCYSVTSL